MQTRPQFTRARCSRLFLLIVGTIVSTISPHCRAQLADQVALRSLDISQVGKPISAMATTPDGKRLYLAGNGQVFSVDLSSKDSSLQKLPVSLLGNAPFEMIRNPDDPTSYYVADSHVVGLQIVRLPAGTVEHCLIDGAPNAIVLNASAHRLYVASKATNKLAVIDTQQPCSAHGPSIDVDSPVAIAVEDGQIPVFVASEKRGEIFEVPGPLPLMPLDTPVPNPSAMVYDPDHHHLFVVSKANDVVEVIDPFNDKHNAFHIPKVEAIVFDRAHGQAYVVSNGPADLLRIDSQTAITSAGGVKPPPVLPAPLNSGIGGRLLELTPNFVLVSGTNGIAAIDLRSNAIVPLLRDNSYGALLDTDSTRGHFVALDATETKLLELQTSLLPTAQAKFEFLSTDGYDDGQPLTLTNPYDVSLGDLTFPEASALKGFRTTGSCPRIGAHDVCTYTIYPPAASREDARGQLLIHSGSGDVSVSLCRPVKSPPLVPKPYAPISCHKDGHCDPIPITKSVGEVRLTFAGPGASHFRATTDCAAVKPGAACNATVTFDGKPGGGDSAADVSLSCSSKSDIEVPLHLIN